MSSTTCSLARSLQYQHRSKYTGYHGRFNTVAAPKQVNKKAAPGSFILPIVLSSPSILSSAPHPQTQYTNRVDSLQRGSDPRNRNALHVPARPPRTRISTLHGRVASRPHDIRNTYPRSSRSDARRPAGAGALPYAVGSPQRYQIVGARWQRAMPNGAGQACWYGAASMYVCWDERPDLGRGTRRRG